MMAVHDKHTGGANWKNRTLFHGDNLQFLRAMNSESVDLIATDPPFNKGKDFHATPDSLAKGAKFQDRWSWERDIHQEWVDQLTDDYPKLIEAIESARYAHSDGMGAYLCFMSVRLLEMRRVLKPTGSIYLHCDPTASHYLKAAMDAIFGWKQFRNEIIWHYRTYQGQIRTRFPQKHDLMFWYAVNTKKHQNRKCFQLVYDSNYEGTVDHVRWRKYYVNGNEIRYGQHPATDSRFTAYLKRWEATNRRKPKNGELIYQCQGYVIDDVWTDIQALDPKDKSERIGYPTQKPLALYERIIKSSSSEGDIVLDPFAGCATTCVAAERLKRQWVGIDLWDNAKDVLLERMKKEGMIGEDSMKAGDQTLLFSKDITFTAQVPERTDDKQEAVPFLQVKERVKEPDGPRWTRKEMYDHLLAQQGSKCQGCDRYFDDSRYLELDHNTPRSSGGWNHISNRILLCGPCNKLKSNIYTLIGLRRENKKRGYMAK